MIYEGFIWPDVDKDAHGVIMRDCGPDVAAFIALVPSRKCIVQAGGNVGVYAKALSAHFARVVTVEPDLANYACLQQNLAKCWGIEHKRAAFGEQPGRASVDHMSPANVGAHRMMAGDDVEVIRIDDLPLGDCDAIWLDVEGFELPALKGAAATIDRFSPVIAIEDKGLETHYGQRQGETADWLRALGYVEIARFGNDKVFKR